MDIAKPTLAFLAACSMLALAACTDDEPVQAPPSGAQTERQQEAPGKSATENAKEGLDQLRDAAGQLLKDAGPALDEAREAAKKLGAAVDEIVGKAQDDFKRATEELDKRVGELQQDGARPAGDPAAALAPADQLRTDTRAAARAAAGGVGPQYVGVWAGQAADCARIDQEAVEMFAVITPTTVRRYESVCNMPETPLQDGAAEITAQCVGEGMAEDRTLRLTLPSPDRLTIATDNGAGADLVRCYLPG